jgi:UDP-glucuronate decarboxylase
MKKILVAGGAGFLGSHLCKYLLDQGHQVDCIDNLYTGRDIHIKPLFENKQFKFHQKDIVESFDGEYEEIYNLACPASPPHYQRDRVFTTKTSVIGTLNLLELAKKNKAKFLQASTSEIYGDPKVHPQTEDYWGNVNILGPRSCYDEGKRVAETLVNDFNYQYDVDVRLMRIFNTYGPNMDPKDGRVVSNFIIQALQNEDITVYGKGQQTRSFCYVDDNIRGMVGIMELDHYPGPINIGNPVEFTILELAKLVVKMTNSQSTIVFHDLPKDDPTQRKPDISKAKEVLGWEPEVSLEKGLVKTIEYFKSYV